MVIIGGSPLSLGAILSEKSSCARSRFFFFFAARSAFSAATTQTKSQYFSSQSTGSIPLANMYFSTTRFFLTQFFFSKTIQEYNGEFLKAYCRLYYHDVYREAYNAMAFAGLPPGAGGGEAQREANASAAFILYVPLDWLWFTRFEDYALTPEAVSSELDVRIQYRALEELVYARVIATGAVVAADPFTTRPAITRAELCQQLIFEPHVQKGIHLSSFESRQGQLYKILDVEEQVNLAVAAAAGTYTFRLDNFRLDSAFLMFYLRANAINTDWAIDRMQSDPTATILPGGGSVAALQQITSFRLLANGSVIVDVTTDIENRAVWRKMYWPGKFYSCAPNMHRGSPLS